MAAVVIVAADLAMIRSLLGSEYLVAIYPTRSLSPVVLALGLLPMASLPVFIALAVLPGLLGRGGTCSFLAGFQALGWAAVFLLIVCSALSPGAIEAYGRAIVRIIVRFHRGEPEPAVGPGGPGIRAGNHHLRAAGTARGPDRWMADPGVRDLRLGRGSVSRDGDRNKLGGDTPAERNVISGNLDDGVDLHDGATGNLVLGNQIGTDATGTRPLGNGVDGVFLQDASHNVVGGLGRGAANVVGANGFNGVFLFGDSRGNPIAGNFIGTNPRLDPGLGNNTGASFADGIFLAQFDTPRGPSGNTVLGNTVAYNAGTGISIDLDAAANSAGNRILRNAIFGNGEQGIDLASDGVTANDAGDGDAGPNRLQNAPVLRDPVGEADGSYSVAGALDSTPGARFRIECFASSRAGDGEVFVGSLIATTDADGNSSPFRFRYQPVEGRPYLTATATNLRTGDTSELSAAVGQPPRPASAGAGPSIGDRDQSLLRAIDRVSTSTLRFAHFEDTPLTALDGGPGPSRPKSSERGGRPRSSVAPPGGVLP